MLCPPTPGPFVSGKRARTAWLALGLLGCVACGGGQRARDEAPLRFADPNDCNCKLTAADLAPPARNESAPPPAGRAGQASPPETAAPDATPDAVPDAALDAAPDAATIADRYPAEGAPAGTPTWTGAAIDFNVKDADLANVLRLLAEVGKIDIAIADDVVGTVTLRLGKVPWDQALDAVIRLERLSVSRNGSVLVIRGQP